ncbi:hypothetical protein TpMuguga_02g00233 [Theileria parva strain Muguga]|uniref:uncharacterized protein n=1 Tax=Theileria parva strain Muguga TaxID=333668 RepID=UPI001C61B28A|nr:uncharacterized protein TpMuguga_02g00233 [Theileria parva strain Muguga]EAN32516.2 hypothetical protein TpMuguga_02g00233 [Theileria parva strain Muguga]
MKFQFKLWILICVNVYIKILGLVHSLHIRSPCNYINTSSFPRHLALSTSNPLNNKSFPPLQEKFSSLIFKYSPNSIFNILNNNICDTNVVESSLKRFVRGKYNNKSQYLFISSNNIYNNARIKPLRERIKNDDYTYYDPYDEDFEKFDEDDEDYEDDEEEESEERRLKRLKERDSDKRRLIGVYKNEMDKLIELYNKAQRLYDECGDYEKVCEELNLEPSVEISDDTLVCLARSLLNRPPPPRDYFGRMMYELGFLMIYNNIKKLKNNFIRTLEDRLSGKPEEDFKRNQEYVFGIEPLNFGEKVEPLSEGCLRGLLHESYFEHLEQMAKYNPKRAQKILTVIHRIHKQTKLISDIDEDANDDQIVEDVDNIATAESEAYKDFLTNYPDLKWPTNDDDFLNLYSAWYDPNVETSLRLSRIIKENYLDNLKPESNNMVKHILNPIMSFVIGYTLGKGSEKGIDYLFDMNPELMDFLFRHKGKLKYIFWALSYLVLADQKEQVDYFSEVLKILYSDTQTLENQSMNALMERVCKGLGSENSVESMIKSPSGTVDSDVDGGSEMFDVITRIRRDNFSKLADANNISHHNLRLYMEKVSTLLTFKSFLNFLNVFSFNKFKNPMEKNNEDYLHLQLTNIKEEEPDLTDIKVPGYEEFSEDRFLDPNETEEEEFVDFDPENMFNKFCIMESEGDGDVATGLRQLITSLRYINAISLPISKTSVYRLIYAVGCYLAVMDHLPSTYGKEVLGYYISGEDFIANNMTPEDDYSRLYNLVDKELGLPPPNVKRYRFNAMLMTFFMVQIFTDFEPFVTVTTPKDFGYEIEKDLHLFKSMGVSDEQIQRFRESPIMPSQLDRIEDWAEELQNNRGRIKKHNIKYKYGIVPFDEIFGETAEEKKKRETYEVENLRDDLLSLYSKTDYIPEIIKGISKVFYVSERFLLNNYPKFFVNLVSNIIYKGLTQENNKFEHYLALLNVSKNEVTVNKIRNRIMEIHFYHMNKKYGVDGKNVAGVSENIREVYSDIKEMSSKLELDEEVFLNYFRIYTFLCLMQDLSKIDLTRVLKSDLEKVKLKYESNDIVFINSICELIKEKVYDSKKSLLEATELEDFYLVEKHMQALLDMKRSVTTAVSALVDPKYMYRIERAFQHNMLFKPKKFTCHEIIGTFDIFNTLGSSDESSEEDNFKKSIETTLSQDFSETPAENLDDNFSDNLARKFPEKSHNKVILENYYGIKDKDRLKELKGDWELMEKEDTLSYCQKMKMKEKILEKKLLRPLPLYGIDTRSTYPERIAIEKLVEEGKVPPLFKEIPSEFHVGHRPVDPEYEASKTVLVDKEKDRKAILDSQIIYKAWVIYNYRKRGNTLHQTKNFLSIFPSTKLLVENGYNDWKYVYIRNCLRNDDINSNRDWNRELNVDNPNSEKLDEETTKICERCYEEEVLRLTNAPIDDVADDIGNTTDFFFDPFYPSVVRRINYVFTIEEPTDKQLQQLEKIQKFLKLSDRSVEIVHAKCFSYIFYNHVKNMIKEHEGQKLKDIVTKYIKPFAHRLKISQMGYNIVLNEVVYDHLNIIFFKLFDKCQIGPEVLRNVDRFFKICDDYEITSEHSKFSFGLNTFYDTAEVVEKFIFSSVDSDQLVDMDKLERLCNLIGLKGEERRKYLEKRGIEFYFKYMVDHYKDNIFLETFDDLKNLHHVYGLNEKHFKQLIYRYRLMRVLDAYSGDAGLKDFDRCVEVLMDSNISKYIELDRNMRVNWLINIMNDLLKENKYNIDPYLVLNKNMTDIVNTSEGSENGEIIDLIKLACEKLLIKDDEIMEAFFFHVHENIDYIVYRLNKFIKGTTGPKPVKEEDEKGTSKEAAKEGYGVETEGETKLYDLVSELIKIISLTPKDMTNVIRDKINIKDVEPIKKILIQNSHSSDELAGTLKLVDIFLEK